MFTVFETVFSLKVQLRFTDYSTEYRTGGEQDERLSECF